MNILDYSFARMYFWYKRRYEKYDHKKLVFAAQNGMVGIGVFIGVEISIAITELFNIDKRNTGLLKLLVILVNSFHIIGILIYYRSETKAEILTKTYTGLDKATHKEIRSKIWLIFWITQLICTTFIFYRPVILKYISEYF